MAGGQVAEEVDALLIQLAQRTGGIEPLLHCLFSFLKRKTDFYHIQQPGDRIGFPPGKAKKLVLDAYLRFSDDANAVAPPKEALEARGERLLPEHMKDSRAPVAQDAGTAAQPPPKRVEASGDTSVPAHVGSSPASSMQETGRASAVASAVSKTTDSAAAAGRGSRGEGCTEGKVDPYTSFVTYNGCECTNYRWSQTVDEIVMFIDCAPADGVALKAKELQVDVKRKSVRVALRGAAGRVVVEGDLFGEINQEEVLWHMEHGRYVTLTMEKNKHTWWKSALVGHTEIDTQKVDSTCKLEDYDEGTQAAIRKIMFDQHQKAQGLPTSEELSQQDMLRKAWDAEGSPFKGVPFDPSLVNFSGAGGMPPGMDLPGLPGQSIPTRDGVDS